ncbi:hypothetical protein QQ020_13280 [Fulvivirgaceae bacterium BMA12]|uniref:DUF6794 domain-containing protein n=1 Tax=Agaribacillus aureus TaxID=3051825 RepID=A0ABT8L9U1_9BACT|nr:hypothetical protein [Fulvivirgaceae bacterium BMA12]
MGILILQIILIFSSGISYSQTDCDKYPDDYIPKDLNDAISYLDCNWPDNDKEEFKSKNEDDAVAELHFGTGRAIRNNWDLWSKRKNSLVKYFNKHGIFHPDDISSIILTSFHRKLNNNPIDLDSQVKSYKDYWGKTKTVNDSINRSFNQLFEREFESFTIGDTVKIQYKISVQGKNVWIYRIQKNPDLNETADCYVTGIVKGKRKKTRRKGNYTLTIQVADICGYKKAIYSGLDDRFKVGETYDFFSLEHYKIKNTVANRVAQPEPE